LWCRHTGSDHPQEELAKFGYKSQRKVESFKNPTYYILATSWNLFSKFGQFQNFFSWKYGKLGSCFFFSEKSFVWVTLALYLTQKWRKFVTESEVAHRHGVNSGESVHAGKILIKHINNVFSLPCTWNIGDTKTAKLDSLASTYTSEGNPWLRHSSHPWHLAQSPAAAALACFFKEQEVGGS